MIVAYLLSLLFAIGYGYLAAYNKRVEAAMLAVLDILQSIPVLSFLPGVMLAMVSLFPSRQLGVEFGSIVLIFTGQVWNMAFSFYASLKALPARISGGFTRLPLQQPAEIPAAGIAAGRHRAGVELHGIGRGRLVLPDGLRNVRARQARFPPAWTRLLPAVRRQRRQHRRDHLGNQRHDRRSGADRPAGMASRHRVVRQIQAGASGEFSGAFFAWS